MSSFNENIVELAAFEWLGELGYGLLHGPDIAPNEAGAERSDYNQVILEQRLRSAIATLNHNIPSYAQDDAYRKVIRSTSPNLYEDNRLFHKLLVEGVEIEYKRADGSIAGDVVRLADFEQLHNNDWLAVNQFTIIENKHNRRPDIIIFINGLPVAVIELKNAVNENTTLNGAFNQLQTYKQEIPSLFRTNALLVISDGIEARVGSITANQERFMPWRTVDGASIAAKGSAELETLLKGIFAKNVLLDLIRNFVVFEVDGGHIIKKTAGYQICLC